jgi:chromate transporter
MTSPESGAQSPDWKENLGELARLFLKLGCIGFGGPPAHMALMAEAVVERRQWLSSAEFAEGMAICEILPGPASTQLGIYIGYRRGGLLGGLLAGICFIAPALVLVVALSWAYFHFQGLPLTTGLMFGVKPVVVAAIAAFCWKLAHKTLKKSSHWAIAIAVIGAVLGLKLNMLLVFPLAGAVGMALYGPWRSRGTGSGGPSGLLTLPALGELSPGGILAIAPLLAVAPAADALAVASFLGLERIGDYGVELMWFFLRAGSLVFGGGLTIVPLLEFEVVQGYGWLTQAEFLDGVAIGQLTPGPVLLTVAFVGYKVAGLLGAIAATVAAFLPSFGFIILASPVLATLRSLPWVRAFLEGVTPAALGAVAAASVSLVSSALVLETGDPGRSLIAAVLLGAAAIALIRYRRPLWQLLPLGGAIGLLVGG